MKDSQILKSLRLCFLMEGGLHPFHIKNRRSFIAFLVMRDITVNSCFQPIEICTPWNVYHAKKKKNGHFEAGANHSISGSITQYCSSKLFNIGAQPEGMEWIPLPVEKPEHHVTIHYGFD